MERPEIIDGLRNAIDRGYSMEIAVSSFINAGYNRQDVIDSAKFLGGSVLSFEPVQQPTTQQAQQQISQQQNIQQQVQQIQTSQSPPPIKPKQQVQQFPQQKPMPTTVNVTIQNQPQIPKKRGWGMIIFLIIALFLLLGVLLTVIFAGDFVKEILAKIGLSF